MSTSYFNPPHAGYYNPPIAPQNFKPSLFNIASISLGQTTQITTTKSNNYVVGQLVRLLIPSFYGAQQINNQTGYIISIQSPTSFTINLNSIGSNPFNPSPSYGPTLPQVAAIGDINSGLIFTNGQFFPTTAIPGSFQNISPQPSE